MSTSALSTWVQNSSSMLQSSDEQQHNEYLINEAFAKVCAIFDSKSKDVKPLVYNKLRLLQARLNKEKVLRKQAVEQHIAIFREGQTGDKRITLMVPNYVSYVSTQDTIVIRLFEETVHKRLVAVLSRYDALFRFIQTSYFIWFAAYNLNRSHSAVVESTNYLLLSFCLFTHIMQFFLFSPKIMWFCAGRFSVCYFLFFSILSAVCGVALSTTGDGGRYSGIAWMINYCVVYPMTIFDDSYQLKTSSKWQLVIQFGSGLLVQFAQDQRKNDYETQSDVTISNLLVQSLAAINFVFGTRALVKTLNPKSLSISDSYESLLLSYETCKNFRRQQSKIRVEIATEKTRGAYSFAGKRRSSSVVAIDPTEFSQIDKDANQSDNQSTSKVLENASVACLEIGSALQLILSLSGRDENATENISICLSKFLKAYSSTAPKDSKKVYRRLSTSSDLLTDARDIRHSKANSYRAPVMRVLISSKEPLIYYEYDSFANTFFGKEMLRFLVHMNRSKPVLVIKCCATLAYFFLYSYILVKTDNYEEIDGSFILFFTLVAGYMTVILQMMHWFFFNVQSFKILILNSRIVLHVGTSILYIGALSFSLEETMLVLATLPISFLVALVGVADALPQRHLTNTMFYVFSLVFVAFIVSIAVAISLGMCPLVKDKETPVFGSSVHVVIVSACVQQALLTLRAFNPLSFLTVSSTELYNRYHFLEGVKRVNIPELNSEIFCALYKTIRSTMPTLDGN